MLESTTTPAAAGRPDHEVIVVGAGLGGIGVGVALRKAAIDDFIMVDKAQRVGGTWQANTYPGVAVDIPSFIYSYSFAQKSSWSRLFAPGHELQAYAEEIVDRFGLRTRLMLGTLLTGARFDEGEHIWYVTTDGGRTLTARHLIAAVGGLEQPKLPDIPGIGEFTGELFHTAMWEHDHRLAGKRVGIIGTGASALQVIPEIADKVEHLTVFQRTPIWLMPKVDFAPGALTRLALRLTPTRVPLRLLGNAAFEAVLSGLFIAQKPMTLATLGVEEALKLWMRTQVEDPETLAKLTPDYLMGCKRPSMSNTYLKTFNRPNVTLDTSGIESVAGSSVVTADGSEHELDVLICATGFKVLERGATPPFPVHGRGEVDLGEFWHANRFQSYEGITMHGYPNLFFVPGPYGYAPGSYIWTIEANAAHAAAVINETRRRGATSCEVRKEPQDAWYRKMSNRMDQSHLFTDSCARSNTYYLDYQGGAAGVRPTTHLEMWWRSRHVRFEDYHYTATSPARRSNTAAAVTA